MSITWRLVRGCQGCVFICSSKISAASENAEKVKAIQSLRDKPWSWRICTKTKEGGLGLPGKRKMSQVKATPVRAISQGIYSSENLV